MSFSNRSQVLLHTPYFLLPTPHERNANVVAGGAHHRPGEWWASVPCLLPGRRGALFRDEGYMGWTGRAWVHCDVDLGNQAVIVFW